MKPRCYLPPENWGKNSLVLSGKPAHHLLRVLRLKAGASLVCFNGVGEEASAQVEKATRSQLTLSLEPPRAAKNDTTR